MTNAPEAENGLRTTGGVVGALIGAVWGIGFFRFDPNDMGLLLVFMAFGLAAGVAGGAMMGALRPTRPGPMARFLQVVTIGAISGIVFGVFLFVVGALFMLPSGGVGGALTYFLVRFRWFRWVGGTIATAVAVVALWQLQKGVP
jgi:hypothetical protein